MEKTKKERRVGTFTFGAMLIVVGIAVVLMTFTGMELLKYVLTLWPVAIIFLGIEILVFSCTQKEGFKIDFGSIILMCITLFLTAVFSVGNYAVNKVLYDEDVKALVVNDLVADTRYYHLDGEVTIKTDGDQRIIVRFTENSYPDEGVSVEVKPTYLVGEVSVAKIVDFQNDLFYNATIHHMNEFHFSNLPDFVDRIYIVVRGADEHCLKQELI